MSAEILKQLRIKTSMLKRLRKQYESYQKEKITIAAKISQLEHVKAQSSGNQDIEYQIKKHRQFLAESESVSSNVKQKLIQAFQGLVQYLQTLSQKAQIQEITNSEQKANAENLVLDVQTFLENLQS